MSWCVVAVVSTGASGRLCEYEFDDWIVCPPQTPHPRVRCAPPLSCNLSFRRPSSPSAAVAAAGQETLLF